MTWGKGWMELHREMRSGILLTNPFLMLMVRQLRGPSLVARGGEAVTTLAPTPLLSRGDRHLRDLSTPVGS